VYWLGVLNSVLEELACFISFHFVPVSSPAFITCRSGLTDLIKQVHKYAH